MPEETVFSASSSVSLYVTFTYILIRPTPVATRLPFVSIVAKPLFAGVSAVASESSPVSES